MEPTKPETFAADRPGTPDRWLVLFLVALSYFVLYLHRNLINYVQPPLKAELELTDAQIGLLSQAFFLPYAVAQVGVGYLSDRFRRRTVLLWSLVGSVMALAAMGLVRSFAELYALRVLMALAQSASVPAIAGAIADCFAPRTRSTAVGIYLASYNLSLVLGGRLGGRIADTPVWTFPSPISGGEPIALAGWRMAMLIFGGVGALAALVVWLLFREPARTERIAGSGLGSSGAPLGPTLLIVLRVRAYLAIMAVFVLTAIVILAIQYWLARYLHDRFGVSLEQAGWEATIWVQCATVVGLFCGGKLGDWCAGRWIAGRTSIQLVGLVMAVPAVALLGTTDSEYVLVLAMLVYGFSVGLYQANLWTATFEVVDPAARSTAIGLLNVASGVFGSWFNPLIGRYHEQIGGLGNALSALSLLVAVSAVLLVFSSKFLLPRDYRGPLTRHSPIRG